MKKVIRFLQTTPFTPVANFVIGQIAGTIMGCLVGFIIWGPK